MSDETFTEPLSAVIEAAHRAGFLNFSEPRLKRLRLADLLPSHRRIGNRRLYPTGTMRQLLALLTIERDETPRSLRRLGWRAWCFGWPMPERYWQPVLTDAAEFWDRTIPRITRLIFDESYQVQDDGFDLFDRMKVMRYPLKWFRQLRKRVGTHLDTLVIMMLKVGIGRFEAFDMTGVTEGAALDDLKKDAAILDRGLGLHYARKHRLSGQKPWLSGDITQNLECLSKSLRGVSLRAVLSQTPIENINQSRSQLIIILCYIASAYELLKTEHGLHAFGFGVISKFLRIGSPRIEALFLLLFQAVKRDPQFAADAARYVSMLLAIKPSTAG